MGQSWRVGRAVLCTPKRRYWCAAACRGLPALPPPATTEDLLNFVQSATPAPSFWPWSTPPIQGRFMHRQPRILTQVRVGLAAGAYLVPKTVFRFKYLDTTSCFLKAPGGGSI